jgi:acyl-CoA dehydrogenase
MMKTAKESDLYQFLKTLTPRIADRVHDLVNFEFDPQLSQRKLVEFGQLMSRIFSMELVSEMEERGFRKDLIENALILLKQDVSMLLNTLRFDNKTLVVEGYESDSYWFNY